MNLYILAGADMSLVGLSVHNCKVLAIPYSELHRLVIRTLGVEEENLFMTSLLQHNAISNFEDTVIVLEESLQNGMGELLGLHLIEMLKLYRSQDIYSCYEVSYRVDGEKLLWGGRGKIFKTNPHGFRRFSSNYSLTEEEKRNFPTWFDEYNDKLNGKKSSKKYKAMLQTYGVSYCFGLPEQEFITLFSILEMIFGAANSEITYQISRGTALLLSVSPDEMNDMYRKMKKLYSVRSEYVHDGRRVSIEKLCELREIVRKVLIKLADIDNHTKEDFKELQRKILLGGYSSFE